MRFKLLIKSIFLGFTLLFSVGLLNGQKTVRPFNGFFNFTYEDTTGKLLLEISDLEDPFIYVNALAAGVGSNDIGLDRGQLGNTRLVKFLKAGNKILLVEDNLKYRAISNNKAEVQAIEEAFAQSIIWGFKIEKTEGKSHFVDMTSFLLSDAHNIVKTLGDKKQGTYKVDKMRSAIYLDNTMSFPNNSEFESIVTYVGSAKGKEIKSVTPTPDIISVRLHHSFVKLPEPGYTPRVFHPNSGYFPMRYMDYATPIHKPIEKRFITRHRLEKTNPNAALSPVKEPIIYYIDPGCPEPVKSALIDGANWWAQAFEYAGFQNAFQIKELPVGAHPLDIRYNMIQWVHRSTRGWSYGASVADPRTGEIIKGHVSLGSLRVRQDFMIAQGLLSPYGQGDDQYGAMTEIALARLRQLSAHEVGHTIGLAHNFAASIDGRASVMDYPHPYILSTDAASDFSSVYDNKIGQWDKLTIKYGYAEFKDAKSEARGLDNIINEMHQQGLSFISDPDARPAGSAHGSAHLWDNGKDIVGELKRLIKLRRTTLSKFGKNTIPSGTPYSELEKILVPIYLMHRYQVEAAAKIIGGVQYSYSVKGDPQIEPVKPINDEDQYEALNALLETLEPQFLSLPEKLLELLPPAAYGYNRSKESFKSNTGLSFDPLAAAESSASHSLSLMLNPQRLARINQNPKDANALPMYMDKIISATFNHAEDSAQLIHLALMVEKVVVLKLIENVRNAKSDHQVRATALFKLKEIAKNELTKTEKHQSAEISNFYLTQLIKQGLDMSKSFVMPEIEKMPPGSPIGCGH